MENTIHQCGVTQWEHYFDEQGLVAATLSRYHTYYMISLVKIPVVQEGWKWQDFTHPLCHGYHFVSVNQIDQHKAWLDYRLHHISLL
jgi:hypothetical protein